jgi:hypothetical protein
MAGAPEHKADNIPEADEVIEKLTRRLHHGMEHLDPTEDPEWDFQTDHQKEFYRLCIMDLLVERDLIESAIARS